jgi:hypothetical protein
MEIELAYEGDALLLLCNLLEDTSTSTLVIFCDTVKHHNGFLFRRIRSADKQLSRVVT